MKAVRKSGSTAAKGGNGRSRGSGAARAGANSTVRNKPVTQKESKGNSQGTDARESAAMAAGGTDAASVEKIRDILFGPQMRDHERKVLRLEEKLLKETADLKEDVRKSLAASDAFVKKELEALSSRLKAEQEERKDAVKSLAQELKELNQTLQQKTSKLDERLATSERELREQMLDQYRNLSEEIRQKSQEAAEALAREAGDLRFEKTDRTALAALFTEVGLRLRDEWKLPGAEHLKNSEK